MKKRKKKQKKQSKGREKKIKRKDLKKLKMEGMMDLMGIFDLIKNFNIKYNNIKKGLFLIFYLYFFELCLFDLNFLLMEFENFYINILIW